MKCPESLPTRDERNLSGYKVMKCPESLPTRDAGNHAGYKVKKYPESLHIYHEVMQGISQDIR